MFSYFFVPGNKINYIKKIPSIRSDHFIIDLEDSVNPGDTLNAVNNLVDLDIDRSNFIRIPFAKEFSRSRFDYLNILLKEGFRKFVLPKIRNGKDFNEITSHMLREVSDPIDDFEFIVLIENPIALLNLSEILDNQSITGVGLGSHDYCESMRMKHTQENIYWAKIKVLNHAKAFGKLAIDIASMNIRDGESFSEECMLAFSQGFDGKFLIHPFQLEIFSTLRFFSGEDIKTALILKKHIIDIGGINNFNVLEIDGNVIERPHLPFYQFVLEKSNNGTF